LLNGAELAYDLEGWHLAVATKDRSATGALRDLAFACDRRLLLIKPDREALWAWFGGRRRPDPDVIASTAADLLPTGFPLAFGEPGRGIEGWRLTHRQATAVLPVALRGLDRPARYADDALLACVLHDEVFTVSLHGMYLSPLEAERDNGTALRETLRAYFAAGHNVTSTAAALQVNRHTVAKRLRKVEEHLGRSLASCGAEMEAALRLAKMVRPGSVLDHRGGGASLPSGGD
jgi:hypothetical protein